MRTIRVFSVSYEGYCDFRCSARSASKARARAWRLFCEAVRPIPFLEFVTGCHTYGVPSPQERGRRIRVAGRPATQVYDSRALGRVTFMYDDSDKVLFAHPGEVEDLASLRLGGAVAP